MKRSMIFLLTASLAILLAACGGSGLPATNLAIALKYAPEDTTDYFAFTDWGILRTSLGGDQLSHTSTKQELSDFYGKLVLTEANTGYWFTRYQDVGWDYLDLEWEVSIYAEDQASAIILKFRDTMDFGAFQALLTQRGYSQETYQGVTLYSHSKDFEVYQYPLLNVAFLDQGKILLGSNSPDSVKTLVDTAAGKATSLAQNPAAAEIVTRLGSVPAAYLISGESVCVPFQHPQMWSQVGIDPDVTPFLSYDMLGWGYRRQDGKATGWFIFHYADAATAAADLPARQKLAENGISSFEANHSYSESVFTLQKITAEGNLLVLEVSPLDDKPRRIVGIIESYDLMFASCSN